MIEINLLPRASRKTGRRLNVAGLGGALANVAARVRDPFLVGAAAAVLVSAAGVGLLHLQQIARTAQLAEREQQAVQDSTRYAAILGEKRAAEAQRDSILRQLEIIRSIDHDRYVWPHIMQEVSRALPAYTWLTSLNQTSALVSAAARRDSAQAAADSVAVKTPPLLFRIVGHTVDMQALTRFMTVLEASPFIQNVQLARTDATLTEGKQVTEFHLDAQYEIPDPSVLRMVPVTLSLR